MVEDQEDFVWETVSNEGDVIKLAPGDFIEGDLIQVSEGKQFSNKIYRLRKLDNSVAVLFGSRMLNRLMVDIQIGTHVLIERAEDKPLAWGRTLHVYHVKKAKRKQTEEAKASSSIPFEDAQ